MSRFSSRSVLCRHPSRTCAPPRPCRRAISLASSHFSSATRLLNSREPMTFVLSPTSRSEEHTSELQSQSNLVCRLLLEKKKTDSYHYYNPQRHKLTSCTNTSDPSP